jgi:ribonuclease-3
VKLSYNFRHPELLQTALRHESAAQQEGLPSQERLEFLGDSVLGMVVSDFLWRQFPEASEGSLTWMKQELVCTRQLAAVARQLELGPHIKLGKGIPESLRSGSRLLADTVEAILGAVYLDGGLSCASRLVGEWLEQAMANLSEPPRDFKSLLQERTQALELGLPEYSLLHSEGPSHAPTFDMEVRVQGRLLGQGRAGSKREAEQEAASQALDALAQGLEGCGWQQSEGPAA